MKKILAINGSYREGGVTDQILDHFEYAANTFDMQIETAFLRNLHIEFCTNCRRCTQEAGRKPGTCIHEDEMNTLIQKIENADFYVFASPTNMYSSTALFRRFLERLVVYGYWPWSKNAPEFRKEGDVRKKAILVSSCAAPGFMGRYFSDRRIQLASATPSRLNEKARWYSTLASPSNQRLRGVWAMHTLPGKNGTTSARQ